jgi:hypothetical protein
MPIIFPANSAGARTTSSLLATQSHSAGAKVQDAGIQAATARYIVIFVGNATVDVMPTLQTVNALAAVVWA